MSGGKKLNTNMVIGTVMNRPMTCHLYRQACCQYRRINEGRFTEGDLWGSFGSILLAYAIVCYVGGVVLWRVAIVFIWSLENNVIRDIHQTIFNHMIRLSSTFHANRFAGSLVSQANKFAGAYVRIADSIVFEVTTLILSFIFTGIILWPKAPLVVLLLFGFSAIFITVSIDRKSVV